MDWLDTRLTEASYAGDYRVHVRFGNALEADIDFSDFLHGHYHAPLKDKSLFSQVRVNQEAHVLEWPNGADMAPEITFERALQAARKSV
jgi:hypothetical protein